MNERYVAGVIGDPVSHSLSPVIHTAAYAALGLAWQYGCYTVRSADVTAAVAGARALGFRGLSVTMPHKEAVARIADQTTSRVEHLGAANTLSFRAGVVVAESTDGTGLVEDVRDIAGLDPKGATCAVLGAGGAARAVVLALAEAGANSILVVNRTKARAEAAVGLAPTVARHAKIGEISEAELVVNATPMGMAEVASSAGGGLDIPSVLDAIRSGQLFVDLIYSPALTPLMVGAAERGARTRNGLGTLIAQAAHQIEIWTGLSAPRPVMWEAAERALGIPSGS